MPQQTDTQTQKLRGRLIGLLEDLFQLDQPDLDFGFYRIMHAKAGQVKNFLEEDLLSIIEDAFGEADGNKVEQARQQYEALKKEAADLGAPDPDEAPKVKEAKAAWESAKESGSSEGEIYDHLYRFFERYYDQGDFMSRRYYARETDAKAAPYAVPYDGREVYLHWANRDQYYIKTSEYLSNFTFDLANAPELQGELFEHDSLKFHCRIVEAEEGEHNNVKATENTERYFIIHVDEPVKLEDGELVIQFEYRQDPEKTGQDKTWRQKRLDEAADVIKKALPKLSGAQDYGSALLTKAPTDKEPARTLLDKYLAQYTARNTMDYFIHKDLGGFLRRELDFYIKNEIMRLDDIESADAPRVQTYLDKIKVLRQIAHHLIDFLTQLEEFQKKLWLKKKFVTETQYCITLDRIPESFYEEIAANDAQRAEWVDLFAIDELDGYVEPLNTEFLKNNPFLVLDTALFSEEFKANLLAELEEIDGSLNGLLVNSENFQALRLLKEKYAEHIDCIYIDPPYNTSASEIIYKNSYKHSSWMSLIDNRLAASHDLLKSSSILCATIDDVEFKELYSLIEYRFGESNVAGVVPIRINPSGRPTEKGFALTHEYAIFATNSKDAAIHKIPRTSDQLKRFKERDSVGIFEYRNLRREGSNSNREDGERQFFPIYANLDEGTIRVPEMVWHEDRREWEVIEKEENHETVIWPVNDHGREKNWRWSDQSIRDDYSQFVAKIPKNGNGTSQVYYKYRPNLEGTTPLTFWADTKYSATEYGTAPLKNLFGENVFSYPKSIHAVEDCISIMGMKYDQTCVLDYFAGSGTTGHAVINLNREDDGNRNFFLVEMGDYFDEATLPRIKKVIYSREWTDGKPKTLEKTIKKLRKDISDYKKELAALKGIEKQEDYDFEKQRLEGLIEKANEKIDNVQKILESGENAFGGISHAFKYIRLESYEDALNNLAFREEEPAKQKALESNPDFRRDYMLRYWLEFETKDSPSLLNVDWFDDPAGYTLKIKKPGTDEYAEQRIDLIETFNWLIGLHVDHIDAPRTYTARFKREEDPELPGDQTTRLVLDGRMEESSEGKWWFRKVEGRVCRTPGDKSNMDRVLIIWRKLTGNLEEDNLMLDEWFKKYRLSTQDTEFDVIYVNGSNNLPNLRQDDENWKVRLIEETFHQQMWDVEG